MIDNEKPVQQKLRKIHPNLENRIKNELNKLLKAKIIFPFRHSKWFSNMVPVRKKNRDIRICIDFRNLNKACQKDNFPLPPMEQILQAVEGSELMSFLDGFSGYNQVLVHPDYQLKTTFRTKWDTYAYRKMPFGLINVGATFQRAMDISFKGLVNKSVVIYLDDITVYSKKRGDHLKDLKQIFQRFLRQAIINAPSLATPNFSEPFILYTFASDKSYAAILTQTNQEKMEAPIAFFSSNLQGAELNYSDVEKQAYAVFKAIKYFRPFLLKTHTKIIYISNVQVCEVSLNDEQSLYANIIYYLKNGYAPSYLDYIKKRALILKAKQYQLINDILFRINYDYVLFRCLEKSKANKVLQELHDGPASGHYAGDATAHKILRAGYYWPTLFKDSHSYVSKFQVCQTTARRQKKPSLPLQPVNINQPFSQWGLDIIGEIVPHSSKQPRYILTATDYFTKWVEAVPLKTANVENIIEFIDQSIITKFGLPSTLMFDNASYFSGNAMTEFALKRGFKFKYSANYYPQGNGLAESTNKNLIRIIKRTLDQNHKNWHKSLIYALWANRITRKASIGTSPFNLVYGREVVLPTHLEIPSLSLVQYIDEVPTSSLHLTQMEIIKLEEQ
eukprot:PITA_14823